MLLTDQMGDVDNLLDSYRRIVLNANKTLNLVSRKSVGKLIPDLIDESLLPLSWDACKIDSSLLDIGSGGGFPGIPLKIARPEITLTLLDANRKKYLFLTSAIRQLGLENASAVWSRHEDYAGLDGNVNRFGTITARGVGDFDLLARSAAVLLKPGGELIVWLSTLPEWSPAIQEVFAPPDILMPTPGLLILKASVVTPPSWRH